MATTVTPRQAALWWASGGFKVLPLHAVTDDGTCTCGWVPDPEKPNEKRPIGKHPFGEFAHNGLKDATTDPAIVRAWFDERYWINYGVVTDGLLVIDVDPRNGGDKTWAELTGQPTRPLISTWQVRTGGDGLHVIFKNPTQIPSGKLDKGIEIKGGPGGYIVGAMCKHASGKIYDWVQQQSPGAAPLADPPDWLLEIIKTRTYLGRLTPPQEWRRIAAGRLHDGDRHNTLLRMTGHLIAIPGVDPIEVRELLLGWNEGRCDPPLPTTEIIQMVENLAERELQKRKWL
jgi:Bifunctional DNA primase/polymerase, N-terminal/Primase C terminal 1 (PriCT-1)